uniref:AMP-dependent synthetase/ligase domain-containing protein n=1 Tax=Panagrolaimus sp. ES5 TaxID=591445 RepID=A0AC34GHW5_9BILA
MFLPFYHIFGVGALMVNLHLGVPTVTMPKYDFDMMCKTIQDYKVRMMFMVPPVFILLKNNEIKYDISSLEFLLLGAAPVSKEAMLACQKRLPHLKKVMQGYGMTEVVMAAHANSLKED